MIRYNIHYEMAKMQYFLEKQLTQVRVEDKMIPIHNFTSQAHEGKE